MTPQEAQKLLDAATPGPWGVESGVAGAAVYSKVGVVCDGTGVDDAPLIASAPALAQLVAGLRYEYAVQDQFDKSLIRGDDDDGICEVLDPEDATWSTDRDERAKVADWLNERFPHSPGWHIVRRLVTDVEVVA